MKLLNRSLTCLFPLVALAVAGGCGDGAGGSDSPQGSGGVAGVGGAGSGGAVVGSGGVATGGAAPQGTGGALASGGSASGGAPAGTGGVAAGGAPAGSGGEPGGTGGSAPTGPVFHVFMLMGQSNMAGVAVRQASDANSDPRLQVLGGCGYTQGQWSTVNNPPLSECPGEKGWNPNNSVDPGIWFGKTLLPALPEGHTI